MFNGCEKVTPGMSPFRMTIAAVEQIGCAYIFTVIRKNPAKA